MATMVETKDKVWEQQDGEDFMAYLKRTEKELDKLTERSNLVDLKGNLVGVVVKFGVADGYALYEVVKSKPLTLRHIPFGDAYRIPDAHIRGLRKDDIVQMAHADRHLRAMFRKES